MKHFLILAVCVISILNQSNAQKSFSLKEAIDYAKINNQQLNIQKLNIQDVEGQ